MVTRSAVLGTLASGVVGLSACSGAPATQAGTGPHESDETSFEKTATSSAALSSPVARSTAIANAEQWVNAQLLYCQSPNGQPDPDTACSSVCQRESNAAWDPYRSDCSGFVSWAWELPAPGLTTADFAPYDTTVTSAIQCADMKPGDAANRSPNRGHIVLFKEWITPGSKAVFLEEPGCSASQPYAREFTSTVTCSGSTVNIAYEGDTFEAIRYAKIEDDPDAGTGGTGGTGSADAGTSRGDAGSSHTDGGTSQSSADGGSTGTAGSGTAGSASGTSGTGDTPGADGGSSGVGFANLGTPGAGCDVAPGRTDNGWSAAGCLALGALVLGRRRRGQRR